MEKMGYDHLASPLTMRALSCAARELGVEANSLEAHPVRGYGATEFLLDMARHGHDISPWHDEINQPMIAADIGFFAVRSLKPPLAPVGTLREMQALSAAAAYEIWQAVKA